MSGPGSTGNVLAALASFFIPGLGQLLQGRLLLAAVQFVLAAALWYFLVPPLALHAAFGVLAQRVRQKNRT